MKKLNVKSFLIMTCVAMVIISAITTICIGLRVSSDEQDKPTEIVDISRSVASDVVVDVAKGQRSFKKINSVFSPLSECETLIEANSFESLAEKTKSATLKLSDDVDAILNIQDMDAFVINILMIEGNAYSFESMGTAAFGIVDLVKGDNVKELFVVEYSNWNMSTRFFRYTSSGEIVELGYIPGGHIDSVGADFISESGDLVKYTQPIMYDGQGKIASSIQQLCWFGEDYLISVYDIKDNDVFTLLPIHWQSELQGKTVVIDEDFYSYKVNEDALLKEMDESPNGDTFSNIYLEEPVKLSVGDVVTIDSFIYATSETDISRGNWVIEVSGENIGEYVYLSLYSQ